MLTAMAAAALGGYVLCGINNTRRGDGLARDIARVDCQLLITDAEHRHLLDGLDLPGVPVLDSTRPATSGPSLAANRDLTPHREVGRHGHLHDDLHLGHQRRPEGGAGAHTDGALRGQALAERFGLTADPTSATCRCRCSTPTRSRGLGPGAGVRRGDGAREVLARRASSTTSAATARRT